MKAEPKIALIGHSLGNYGHRLMLYGAVNMIRQGVGPNVSWQMIEQHRPTDILKAFHPLKLLSLASGDSFYDFKNKLLQADHLKRLSNSLSRKAKSLKIAISVGGPVLANEVPSSAQMIMMYPFLQGVLRERGVSLLNLSMGSCWPYEKKDAPELSENLRCFFSQLDSISATITVRDSLAESTLKDWGIEAPLIEDSGFVSGPLVCEQYEEGSLIALNFQPKGANELWNQSINVAGWATELRVLVNRLKKRYSLIFIAHGPEEKRLANSLDSAVAVYEPSDDLEYQALAKRIRAGICTRIHAGIALARMGVPVLGIGTDTRLYTLKSLGLPTAYVNEVNAQSLEESLESILSRRKSMHESLWQRKTMALSKYSATVAKQYEKAMRV